LRRYRDAYALWIVGSYEALVLVVVAVALATASAHDVTWWIVVPALIALSFLVFRLTSDALRACVRETPEGLSARAGKYACDVKWSDIVSFGYVRLFARDVVVVELSDGTGRHLYGATRRMVWRSEDSRRRLFWRQGGTVDFAAYMNTRLRLFRDTSEG